MACFRKICEIGIKFGKMPYTALVYQTHYRTIVLNQTEGEIALRTAAKKY